MPPPTPPAPASPTFRRPRYRRKLRASQSQSQAQSQSQPQVPGTRLEQPAGTQPLFPETQTQHDRSGSSSSDVDDAVDVDDDDDNVDAPAVADQEHPHASSQELFPPPAREVGVDGCTRFDAEDGICREKGDARIVGNGARYPSRPPGATHTPATVRETTRADAATHSHVAFFSFFGCLGLTLREDIVASAAACSCMTLQQPLTRASPTEDEPRGRCAFVVPGTALRYYLEHLTFPRSSTEGNASGSHVDFTFPQLRVPLRLHTGSDPTAAATLSTVAAQLTINRVLQVFTLLARSHSGTTVQLGTTHTTSRHSAAVPHNVSRRLKSFLPDWQEVKLQHVGDDASPPLYADEYPETQRLVLTLELLWLLIAEKFPHRGCSSDKERVLDRADVVAEAKEYLVVLSDALSQLSAVNTTRNQQASPSFVPRASSASADLCLASLALDLRLALLFPMLHILSALASFHHAGNVVGNNMPLQGAPAELPAPIPRFLLQFAYGLAIDLPPDAYPVLLSPCLHPCSGPTSPKQPSPLQALFEIASVLSRGGVFATLAEIITPTLERLEDACKRMNGAENEDHGGISRIDARIRRSYASLRHYEADMLHASHPRRHQRRAKDLPSSIDNSTSFAETMFCTISFLTVVTTALKNAPQQIQRRPIIDSPWPLVHALVRLLFTEGIGGEGQQLQEFVMRQLCIIADAVPSDLKVLTHLWGYFKKYAQTDESFLPPPTCVRKVLDTMRHRVETNIAIEVTRKSLVHSTRNASLSSFFTLLHKTGTSQTDPVGFVKKFFNRILIHWPRETRPLCSSNPVRPQQRISCSTHAGLQAYGYFIITLIDILVTATVDGAKEKEIRDGLICKLLEKHSSRAAFGESDAATQHLMLEDTFLLYRVFMRSDMDCTPVAALLSTMLPLCRKDSANPVPAPATTATTASAALGNQHARGGALIHPGISSTTSEQQQQQQHNSNDPRSAFTIDTYFHLHKSMLSPEHAWVAHAKALLRDIAKRPLIHGVAPLLQALSDALSPGGHISMANFTLARDIAHTLQAVVTLARKALRSVYSGISSCKSLVDTYAAMRNAQGCEKHATQRESAADPPLLQSSSNAPATASTIPNSAYAALPVTQMDSQEDDSMNDLLADLPLDNIEMLQMAAEANVSLTDVAREKAKEILQFVPFVAKSALEVLLTSAADTSALSRHPALAPFAAAGGASRVPSHLLAAYVTLLEDAVLLHFREAQELILDSACRSPHAIPLQLGLAARGSSWLSFFHNPNPINNVAYVFDASTTVASVLGPLCPPKMTRGAGKPSGSPLLLTHPTMRSVMKAVGVLISHPALLAHKSLTLRGFAASVLSAWLQGYSCADASDCSNANNCCSTDGHDSVDLSASELHSTLTQLCPGPSFIPLSLFVNVMKNTLCLLLDGSRTVDSSDNLLRYALRLVHPRICSSQGTQACAVRKLFHLQASSLQQEVRARHHEPAASGPVPLTWADRVLVFSVLVTQLATSAAHADIFASLFGAKALPTDVFISEIIPRDILTICLKPLLRVIDVSLSGLSSSRVLPANQAQNQRQLQGQLLRGPQHDTAHNAGNENALLLRNLTSFVSEHLMATYEVLRFLAEHHLSYIYQRDVDCLLPHFTTKYLAPRQGAFLGAVVLQASCLGSEQRLTEADAMPMQVYVDSVFLPSLVKGVVKTGFLGDSYLRALVSKQLFHRLLVAPSCIHCALPHVSVGTKDGSGASLSQHIKSEFRDKISLQVDTLKQLLTMSLLGARKSRLCALFPRFCDSSSRKQHMPTSSPIEAEKMRKFQEFFFGAVVPACLNHKQPLPSSYPGLVSNTSAVIESVFSEYIGYFARAAERSSERSAPLTRSPTGEPAANDVDHKRKASPLLRLKYGQEKMVQEAIAGTPDHGYSSAAMRMHFRHLAEHILTLLPVLSRTILRNNPGSMPKLRLILLMKRALQTLITVCVHMYKIDRRSDIGEQTDHDLLTPAARASRVALANATTDATTNANAKVAATSGSTEATTMATMAKRGGSYLSTATPQREASPSQRSLDDSFIADEDDQCVQLSTLGMAASRPTSSATSSDPPPTAASTSIETATLEIMLGPYTQLVEASVDYLIEEGLGVIRHMLGVPVMQTTAAQPNVLKAKADALIAMSTSLSQGSNQSRSQQPQHKMQRLQRFHAELASVLAPCRCRGSWPADWQVIDEVQVVMKVLLLMRSTEKTRRDILQPSVAQIAQMLAVSKSTSVGRFQAAFLKILPFLHQEGGTHAEDARLSTPLEQAHSQPGAW